MPRTIRITPPFLAEVAQAEIDHPGSKRAIKEFLENRRKTPVWQGFGAKDARLKGKLNDTWHVHIVHGHLVLFYGISVDYLDAYCLRDHSYVETAPKQGAFRRTIDAFQAGAFLSFSVEDALRPSPQQAPQMNLAERSALEAIIYDLLASKEDRAAVEAAASGAFDDLRTYIAILAGHQEEPSGFWDAVVAGFGGEVSFRAWLTAAIARIPSTST